MGMRMLGLTLAGEHVPLPYRMQFADGEVCLDALPLVSFLFDCCACNRARTGLHMTLCYVAC